MHERRLGAALTALALLFTMVVGIAGASDLTTGPLVQVSGTSPFLGCTADAVGTQSGTVYLNSEVEPWIDVNRANTSNVVGIFQQDRWSNGGARGLVAGVSLNGGTSFTLVPIPKVTVCSGGTAANGGNYQRATDPWVTFGPNGNLYQLSLSFNDVSPPFTTEDFDHALLASRSTNGGLTWSDPVVVRRDTAPSVFNDKQSITADPTNAGLVYAVWDRLVFPPGKRPSVVASFRSSAFRGPTWFARSTDGGLSWEPARQIYDPGQNDQTIGNQIVVQPNGTLVDILTEFNNENTDKLRGATVRVLRSTDKGASWSGPFLIDRLEHDLDHRSRDRCSRPHGRHHPGHRRSTGRTGRLYATWQDARFSGGQNDSIAFSQSLDGGLTWSAPIKVNQTPTGIPIGEPAGVHAVRRGRERRHDRSHVLRLPQQHGRSEQPAHRLLRRPLPPDDGDRMHEPPQLGERGPAHQRTRSTCSTRPSRAASSRATTRVSRRPATSWRSSRSRTAAIRRAPSSGASGRSSSVAGRFGAPPPRPVAPLEELPPEWLIQPRGHSGRPSKAPEASLGSARR